MKNELCFAKNKTKQNEVKKTKQNTPQGEKKPLWCINSSVDECAHSIEFLLQFVLSHFGTRVFLQDCIWMAQ